jgi:hypothetical protein
VVVLTADSLVVCGVAKSWSRRSARVPTNPTDTTPARDNGSQKSAILKSLCDQAFTLPSPALPEPYTIAIRARAAIMSLSRC